MKTILLLMIMIFALDANEIKLTNEQEKNWQIKTENAKKSNILPLGTFLMEVTTPPNLLHSITLAFDAQINRLFVASYQNVKKGDLIAEVSGKDWIQAQKDAISNAIELRENQTIAKRKNRLCKEDVIPQKECVSINAIVQNSKAKLSASKEILKAYGADAKVIANITNSLKIYQSFDIRSRVSGDILELNAKLGKTVDAGTALAIIKEEGELWIESDMPLLSAKTLQKGQEVELLIDGKLYKSKVLELSPVINRNNQTRHVRFSLPKDSSLLAGHRGIVKITKKQKTLVIDKKSVIKYANKNIVFVKTDFGYRSVSIDILAQRDNLYYVAPKDALDKPIAKNSLATLKSMMETSDE